MLLNFSFHLTPQVAFAGGLEDHRIADDAPIVSENNLPEDFEKLMADHLPEIKRMQEANPAAPKRINP